MSSMHFPFSLAKMVPSRFSLPSLRVVVWSIVGAVVTLLGLTALSWFFLVQSWFGVSRVSFETLYPLSAGISLFSFHRIPLIEFWKETSWLGREAARTMTGEEYDLTEVFSHVTRAIENAENSSFRKIFWSSTDQPLRTMKELMAVGEFWAQQQQQHKKYLLLFQNSDELRATGGFIGSYAVLDFQKPDFWRLEIRDIYDPSGMSPAVESPQGQKEYLSSGEGLKLHDANWFVDFPQSAEKILWFFEHIKNDPQTYDGVIAVNFSTLETLLELVEPIYFADEKTWVNAHEVSQMLRTERADFFPGSQQKVQKLQQLQAALLVQLENLSPEQLRTLGKKVLEAKMWQEIQVFSPDLSTQETLESLGMSGQIFPYAPSQAFFFPVESNVGINKANRWVSRSFTLKNDARVLRFSVTFTNSATPADRPAIPPPSLVASAAHLGYVNYYRLLIPPTMQVLSLQVGGESVVSWDQEIIIATNGFSYQQIGFLVTIPEASQKTVQIDLSVPEGWDGSVLLQKQPAVRYLSPLFTDEKGTSQQVEETVSSFFWQIVSHEAVQ